MDRVAAEFRKSRGQTLVWVAIALVVLAPASSPWQSMLGCCFGAARHAERGRCRGTRGSESTDAMTTASVGARAPAGQDFRNHQLWLATVRCRLTGLLRVHVHGMTGNSGSAVTETVRLSFARVLGLQQMDVSASAAGCMRPSPQACGVSRWPSARSLGRLLSFRPIAERTVRLDGDGGIGPGRGSAELRRMDCTPPTRRRAGSTSRN